MRARSILGRVPVPAGSMCALQDVRYLPTLRCREMRPMPPRPQAMHLHLGAHCAHAKTSRQRWPVASADLAFARDRVLLDPGSERSTHAETRQNKIGMFDEYIRALTFHPTLVVSSSLPTIPAGRLSCHVSIRKSFCLDFTKYTTGHIIWPLAKVVIGHLLCRGLLLPVLGAKQYVSLEVSDAQTEGGCGLRQSFAPVPSRVAARHRSPGFGLGAGLRRPWVRRSSPVTLE